MKNTLLVVSIAVVSALLLTITGCATAKTKTTYPDGRVVETTANSADPAALQAVTAAAQIAVPIIIRATK